MQAEVQCIDATTFEDLPVRAVPQSKYTGALGLDRGVAVLDDCSVNPGETLQDGVHHCLDGRAAEVRRIRVVVKNHSGAVEIDHQVRASFTEAAEQAQCACVGGIQHRLPRGESVFEQGAQGWINHRWLRADHG